MVPRNGRVPYGMLRYSKFLLCTMWDELPEHLLNAHHPGAGPHPLLAPPHQLLVHQQCHVTPFLKRVSLTTMQGTDVTRRDVTIVPTYVAGWRCYILIISNFNSCQLFAASAFLTYFHSERWTKCRVSIMIIMHLQRQSWRNQQRKKRVRYKIVTKTNEKLDKAGTNGTVSLWYR